MSQYVFHLFLQDFICWAKQTPDEPTRRRHQERTENNLPPPFDKILSRDDLDHFDSLMNAPTPMFEITDKGKRLLKAFEEFHDIFYPQSWQPDNSPTGQELEEEKLMKKALLDYLPSETK